MSEGKGFAKKPIYEVATSVAANVFVYPTADNRVATCGSNGKAVGISMEAVDGSSTVKTIDVATVGEVGKLKLNETVTIGKLLTSTSAGYGEAADAAGEFVGAIALQGGDQNDIIEVLIVAMHAHASDA